jgi:hypothetical protein
MADSKNQIAHDLLVVNVSGKELITVSRFKMVQKINDHIRVSFIASIPDEEITFYKGKNKTDIKMPLKVFFRPIRQKFFDIIDADKASPADKLVFDGIVTRMDIVNYNNNFQIKVEAASHTYNLDVERHFRSFKNPKMKFSELVNSLMDENKALKAKFGYLVNEAELTKFFLQYDETDWQFLVRMASQLNTGLVANKIANIPHFYFGIPDSKPIDSTFKECKFSIIRDTLKFDFDQKKNPDVKINDYQFYEVKESGKLLNIGDEVTLDGRTLYVYQAIAELIGSEVVFNYLFSTKNGLKQCSLLNERIHGSSLDGTVVDIQKDKVKLRFDFDKNANYDQDCLFPVTTPYSGTGHTGWYVMPEMNDRVKLFFPSNCENNAFVITTVRQKELPDDVELDAQYLRTKFNQQLMAGSLGIKFTTQSSQNGGANLLVRVHSKLGIQLTSEKDIVIHANQDLLIKTPGMASFTAGNELLLSSKIKNTVRMNTKIQCEGTYFNKLPSTAAVVPELKTDLSNIIFTPAAVQQTSNPEKPNKPEDGQGKDGDDKGKEGNVEKGIVPVVLPGVGNTYFEKKLVDNLQKFIKRCKDELGVNIKFSSVYRPKEHQKHLYDIFYYPEHNSGKRSALNQTQYNKHGLSVTNVVGKPATAPHTMGGSFDLSNVTTLITNGKFGDVRRIAAECGFKWQGSKDKVHFGNYDYGANGYKSREDMVDYNNKRYHQLEKNYHTICPTCGVKYDMEN